MKLFDSHCHLDDRAFKKDLKSTIERASAAGVSEMMIAGVDLKTAERAVSIADQYKGVYAAVGIHPHHAEKAHALLLKSLCELAENPQVKAWGEIGLDFNRMYSSREKQEEWFTEQLRTADEFGLPIIFHERDSGGRLIEILKKKLKKDRQGVIHCFSGNREELEQYLKMGFYIGITGIVTMQDRGAPLRRLVPYIPTDRILIETDAPYLTPAPQKNRFRRNEPAFVKTVLLKLAEIRDEDAEILADKVQRNTYELFRISCRHRG